VETIKRAGKGYARLYGWKPKSLSALLGLITRLRLWRTASLRRHLRFTAWCMWTLPLPRFISMTTCMILSSLTYCCYAILSKNGLDHAVLRCARHKIELSLDHMVFEYSW